jgi:hypothetical protein
MVGGTGNWEWSHGGELGWSESYGVEGGKWLGVWHKSVRRKRRWKHSGRGTKYPETRPIVLDYLVEPLYLSLS